jgi:hypothetical protein
MVVVTVPVLHDLAAARIAVPGRRCGRHGGECELLGGVLGHARHGISHAEKRLWNLARVVQSDQRTIQISTRAFYPWRTSGP